MKKLLFVKLIAGLYALWLLTGCIREVSPIKIEVTRPLVTPSPTQGTLLQLPTETTAATVPATAVPKPIPMPEPFATPTLTAIPTMPVLLQPNVTTSPLVCSQVKSYINIQQETNNESWRLMDFVFENENTLTFLMWSDRPDPGPTPTPRTGPPAELRRSHRILLKGLTWDFNSSHLVENPVTGQSAIQNPCGLACLLEVVGVAPDNSWQLLQLTDVPTDYQGFWLVNQDTVANLIPYVPSSTQWRWSNDSRMLWLIYTLHDMSGESYAFESMVVDLSAPASPQIVFQSWNPDQIVPNLLSPVEYNLVFSRADKTVLSYESISFSEPNPPNNQLEVYRIDTSQNPPQLLDTYKARYPFLIDWSDTLQDFVVLELSVTGAVIYALNHEVVYEIPMEVIKQMPQLVGMDGHIRTDFSTEVDLMILNSILERVALSPNLQHIVLMDQSRAWAFSCSD